MLGIQMMLILDIISLALTAVQEGFPSKFWANMIAVVLPFVVSIFFYGGSVRHCFIMTSLSTVFASSCMSMCTCSSAFARLIDRAKDCTI